MQLMRFAAAFVDEIARISDAQKLNSLPLGFDQIFLCDLKCALHKAPKKPAPERFRAG
jgi:hypothetical protein